MRRTNKPLDPTQLGREAQKLAVGLRKRIVGQDEAIRHVVNVYQTYLTGMSSPRRPIASLLFLGPTGSGKTRLVEATAETLVGDVRAVIKVDCAELQHSHDIAKLIGSPPGYLGHRETRPLLSQEVLDEYVDRAAPLSFLLFDEIEKASDALWNLLLGILDRAVLTLGDNRRVDFSRTMIFMTSNLGAAEISAMLRPSLGFSAGTAPCGSLGESQSAQLVRVGLDAARRRFTPEFMNRMDRVIVFRPLGKDESKEILNLELEVVQRRILEATPDGPFLLILTDEAKQHLLHEGWDVQYGARHLKRAIDRLLLHPVSNLIATRQVRAGDVVRVDFSPEPACLSFLKEAEDLPTFAMREIAGTSRAPNWEVLAPAETGPSSRRPREAARELALR